MWPNAEETAGLVTFTDEILNGKLHCLCSDSTVDNDIHKFIEYLQNLRIENFGNLLIGHLNINSIKNKVDMLSYMIENKIDILMKSESKLGNTFPTFQFVICNFTGPLMLDRTRNGYFNDSSIAG